MLIIHITVALASLIFTAIAFFIPSRLKLRLSQALIVMTLGSGTYLVFTMSVNLLKVCLAGLIYTAIVTGGTVAIGRKLALENSKLYPQ